MKNIKLNPTTQIDLQALIDTRLLVQANSGGGKSWLLRRILEQSHGKVQQIVIDLEGEFSTLREKYDYILAGKGGDTPAEPKSAALLARKLLELNASAIIDLYELPHQERKHFVKLFLDSMINAPKELWHPVMVIIDEAHQFCPEKGQAESSDAVIDIATRGRKRGYCVVLATQRLSKLHKDAAAECNNKLIGRTGLDIDMKRASEELGFTSKEQYLSLRSLDAGEFFAFGPALSKTVERIKVGNVSTTHPKAGSRFAVKVAPPTDRIKQVLKKLADLPEEARKEAHTVQEMKQEIKELRIHRCPEVSSQKDIDVAVDKALRINNFKIDKEREQMQIQIQNFFKILKEIGMIVSRELKKKSAPIIEKKEEKEFLGLPVKTVSNFPKNKASLITQKEKVEIEFPDEGEKPLTGGALRMLKVLVSRYPMQMTRSQLATFSKLKPTSGTFGTYLSLLRGKDLIFEGGGLFQASRTGIDEIGDDPNPPQTREDVFNMWRGVLNGGARRMFDALIDAYPRELSREDLAEITDLSATSGTFGTYLSMLRSNGLIETDNGSIKISEGLFF